MEDRIYIEQVLSGKTAAFAVLVDRYKDYAFTIAKRVLRSSEEAEEVSQDAFMKVFQKLHTYDHSSKFSTWLYSIVFRTAISQLRKKGLDYSETDVTTLDHITAEERDPEAELTDKDTAIHVRKVVDKLPVAESVIVTLYYMDGASVKEIAEIMEMTEGNVKVRLMRSRKKLRELLEIELQHEVRQMIG